MSRELTDVEAAKIRHALPQKVHDEGIRVLETRGFKVAIDYIRHEMHVGLVEAMMVVKALRSRRTNEPA